MTWNWEWKIELHLQVVCERQKERNCFKWHEQKINVRNGTQLSKGKSRLNWRKSPCKWEILEKRNGASFNFCRWTSDLAREGEREQFYKGLTIFPNTQQGLWGTPSYAHVVKAVKCVWVDKTLERETEHAFGKEGTQRSKLAVTLRRWVCFLSGWCQIINPHSTKNPNNYQRPKLSLCQLP